MPISDNVEDNRGLWDAYAERWSPATVRPESGAVAGSLKLIGDEWGTPEAVAEVVHRFILPHVSGEATAVEIGVGGGRIAALVAPRVRTLYALDISAKMIERCRQALGHLANIEYLHLSGCEFADRLERPVDFVYAFDVFVHADLHTLNKYMNEIRACLKPGGRALLHTTNITTDAGWEFFAAQDAYSVANHFFVSPQTVREIVQRNGLAVIQQAPVDPRNFYLRRDLIMLVATPGVSLQGLCQDSRGNAQFLAMVRSIRLRSRARPARPYICRFSSLILLTTPSVGPLL